VPTTKHRYTITADESVEHALRRSRRRFPGGTSDSKILAALVARGEKALAQEDEAQAVYEQRRRAAARRLTTRFQSPDGLDYAALEEASARWLPE
jgi:hypothetical protein